MSGSPVNGNFPPGFDGLLGAGLSNVTPRTVGETDGPVLPPAGADVVLPPTGGLVVPPLAGHALLLGVVLGNLVVAVKGTTSKVDSVDSGLGVADGVMTAPDDGLA